MIRVLHINRNYLTSALHQVMLKHFDSSSVSNTVFAPTNDRNLAIVDPCNNVIVAECFNNWDRFFFDLKQYKIRKALKNSVDLNQFDIIHAYTLFTDGNTAMRISLETGIPYVVAVRNTDINDFLKKIPLLRKRGIDIMNRASKVLFLSESYRNQVIREYVPKKYQEEIIRKSVIIPNGIDDFWLNNAVSDIQDSHYERLLKKELRAVCAGRIDKNKNIISAINALLLLKKRGWNVLFTVVGKIEDMDEFNRIKAYEFVKYIDPQPKERLLEIYRNNDIFIMPSYTESFGLVYAEAMSQGIPVIYTLGQGFDGQFPEGKIGYHVNAYKIEDIANAIERIAKDYKRISKSCPPSAAKFNWEDIVQKYMSIYYMTLR